MAIEETCKKARTEYMKAWREANKDRIKEYSHNRYLQIKKRQLKEASNG